jgi:hypothetical protein
MPAIHLPSNARHVLSLKRSRPSSRRIRRIHCPILTTVGEKPEQPVNLFPGGLAESPYGLESPSGVTGVVSYGAPADSAGDPMGVQTSLEVACYARCQPGS